MIDLKTYAWNAVRCGERFSCHRPAIATISVNKICAVLAAESGHPRVDEVRAAVDWALDHKDAASLPAGTVVATKDAAYVKDDPCDITTLFTVDPSKSRPWSADWGADASDDCIGHMLADGTAEVLRIGTRKDTP
jgi:hypothetical protein